MMRTAAIAFCLFLLWGNAAIHAATSQSSAPLPPALLTFAAATQKLDTLHVAFTQEKKLSFLQKPVVSQGHLFFARAFNNTGAPALLWEYTQPAPSGIWHSKGKTWTWAQMRDTMTPATGAEGAVVTAMLEQILSWFALDPQQLQQQYAITQSSEKPCFTLVPLRTGMFSTLNVCLSADAQTLTSLTFTEKQGDATILTFRDHQRNTPPIQCFPDGKALP